MISLSINCQYMTLYNNLLFNSGQFSIDNGRVSSQCTRSTTVTLVLSLCVSSFILSILMFVLGLFFGSLIYKKFCIGSSTPHTTHSTPSRSPVYDEVHLTNADGVPKFERNEAYGTVNTFTQTNTKNM